MLCLEIQSRCSYLGERKQVERKVESEVGERPERCCPQGRYRWEPTAGHPTNLIPPSGEHADPTNHISPSTLSRKRPHVSTMRPFAVSADGQWRPEAFASSCVGDEGLSRDLKMSLLSRSLCWQRARAVFVSSGFNRRVGRVPKQ